jgi:thiosulfate/3-mercaptopyruvate sulfurtransferase
MPVDYANPKLLVDTASLEARLADPALRVFDATVHLELVEGGGYRIVSGRRGFDEAHVPGADFLDIPGELSDPESRLPFTFPSADRFADAMSRHGVGPGTRVVLYSRGGPMWAARVWWMLRAFGFDDAALLDGGFEKWTKEGRPVSAAPCEYPPARFEPRPRPGLIVDRVRVLAGISDGATCIINALPERAHRGEGPTVYARPGRIASSVNAPFHRLLRRDDGTFLPAEDLRALFGSAGLRRDQRAITYCGGGIAASLDAFALVLIGHPDVALYDGSLSEWAADPSLPMETG